MTSRELTPSVSCLCVSKNRPSCLSNAIKLFHAQTHWNKELVIVLDSNDRASHQIVQSLGTDSIKVLSLDTSFLRLGGIRNHSIAAAEGEYICNWDDDDWYHCERIAEQLNTARIFAKPGVVLQRILFHDIPLKNSYLSSAHSWENTILCDKSFLLEAGVKYSLKNKGEDRDFIHELNRLGALFPLIKPQLFIYNRTGINTVGIDHFSRLFSMSQKLNTYQNETIRSAVDFSLSIEDASRRLDTAEFMKDLIYS